jgi:hypothetical protein
MLPALEMLGAKESLNADGTKHAEPVYTIRPIVEAARNGEEVPLLSAPEVYRGRVDEWLRARGISRPVVIVLREASHWPQRNSDLTTWQKLAIKLLNEGRSVVFVRDTERSDDSMYPFRTCPEASKDILFQIALYESAACVLATSAPGFIALFTAAPCLIFPVTNMPDYPPSSDSWWRVHHGIGHGEQFPWSRPDQRIVWDGDSLPSLCKAWDEFKQQTMEN